MGSDTSSAADLGSRLAEQDRPLRLALTHLAGTAVRARIDLDDLLQEIYLRALTAGDSLPVRCEGDGPLRRYLTHIARNVVIDAARAIRAAKRDGRDVRLEHSDWSQVGLANLPANVAGPATVAAANEGVTLIVARFEQLTPEHRRVIGLRQFEGLTARETGLRMGRGEAAVHSLYRRALAAWGVGAGTGEAS
ncbi:MAG: RNA polymerase sigma factor (sigma-70 family) [Planctomycetota bacterium]|jgi:RNA polymerase sigma factor (sigma-70 family)